MKIFINDLPFRIIPSTKKILLKNYDTIIPEAKEKIDFSIFQGDVLIQHASVEIIDKYLQLLKKKANKKVDSITFQVDNFKPATDFIKRQYSVIKAAGGLVVKNGHYLLIYRLKKWDLPKGKLDKRESVEIAAVREVEEECNIKIQLGPKICHTYHTYKRNGKNILKKTYWFKMDIIDESKMAPQESENIEEVRWMNRGELRAALYNTYPSIRHVFGKYFKNNHT